MIDDMADRLFHCEDLSDETVNAIVAALRAGHAMRDSIPLNKEPFPVIEHYRMDDDRLIEAIQAWDAAAKGDE